MNFRSKPFAAPASEALYTLLVALGDTYFIISGPPGHVIETPLIAKLVGNNAADELREHFLSHPFLRSYRTLEIELWEAIP